MINDAVANHPRVRHMVLVSPQLIIPDRIRFTSRFCTHGATAL